MKESMNFTWAVLLLNRETEILKKISDAQNKVRQAVMNREWTDFDKKTLEVKLLGGEFALLENERVQLFASLGKTAGVSASETSSSDEKPFYTLILEFPPDERRELSRLYRELKMETLKMRALNETFLAYLNESKTLAAAFLGAICPSRGGKLYTRKGQAVSPDLRSIVFNNRF